MRGSSGGIDKLIINSAYREPTEHWKYDHDAQSFVRAPGRRPAGYTIDSQASNDYNDAGQFVELPVVNKMRPRVKAWREAGWHGVTGVTRKLLEHWYDPEQRQYQFFFCQLDAMETLIWLVEAPEADRTGIGFMGDGGPFHRICTKLCTGGGKTTVMAMLIAWMICNKATYSNDKRFSKNIFIVAPGLTVKRRLKVLETGGTDNYYTQFGIVPDGLIDTLRQGSVRITNCQALVWETLEAAKKKKSVDKRGPKSDEAYAREILGSGMSNARNILVINDEAHHAWRKNPENKEKMTKEQKEEAKRATIWVSGLDRLHRARGILSCYDFSATPFAPSGKKNDEEALFTWIVSDFGINDGIESGLVKTPRVVVRDDRAPDSETLRSKLYHLYMDQAVRDDVTRAVSEEVPLPDLVRNAYILLGRDWLETFKEWQGAGHPVPPVMISVANRTETAARIKYMFDHKRVPIDELCEPQLTIHIDSKTLERADEIIAKQGSTAQTAIDESDGDDDGDDDGGDAAPKLSKDEAAKQMRLIVDTVGQKGKPGERIRNVISVGMLSEGWDAKTVTHILGLRAFSSQLLCEQIIGRGLRRRSYDLEEGSDLFEPEYVNIFGIPFKFLPHESDEAGTPKPAKPKPQIEVLHDRSRYQIDWPNIIRFDKVFSSRLKLDFDHIPKLILYAEHTRFSAELAPTIDGQFDIVNTAEIDLEKLYAEHRMQKLIFDTAAELFEQLKDECKAAASKYVLLGQIVRLAEKFMTSGKIKIDPPLFEDHPLRRRILYMVERSRIVNHMLSAIDVDNIEHVEPVVDPTKKIKSTKDMQTWFTSKPCNITKKSHISHCVFDSGWEYSEAYQIEKHSGVTAYVKNDHIGFEIIYTDNGIVRKYYPDFLIKLANGRMLVLEVKGQETELSRKKRAALKEWVEAVNGMKIYGTWHSDVSYNMADLKGIVDRYAKLPTVETEEG